MDSEVHELHRRERRRVFDASRTVLVTDRLAEEQRKRRFELHLRQEAAKEQREQSRARRQELIGLWHAVECDCLFNLESVLALVHRCP